MTQTMTRQQEERRMMEYGYASFDDNDRIAAVRIIAQQLKWRWMNGSRYGYGFWINPNGEYSKSEKDMHTAAMDSLKLYTEVTVEDIQKLGSEIRWEEYRNAAAATTR